MFSKIRGFVPQVAVTTALVAPLAAMAALPDGVATAITAAGTDGTTLVGLLAAAGAAIFLIAKVLGKFGVKL